MRRISHLRVCLKQALHIWCSIIASGATSRINGALERIYIALHLPHCWPCIVTTSVQYHSYDSHRFAGLNFSAAKPAWHQQGGKGLRKARLSFYQSMFLSFCHYYWYAISNCWDRVSPSCPSLNPNIFAVYLFFFLSEVCLSWRAR